jgi:hypothetical protein
MKSIQVQHSSHWETHLTLLLHLQELSLEEKLGDDVPSKLITLKEKVLTVGLASGLGLLLSMTRTATVKFREPSVLAVLSKEDFWIILADLEEAS